MARFDLNLLGALEALLTERNVTRAAEKLNVTQPTMSGMLIRLRHQFSDELLVKVGRNLELTPLGESLLEPVRETLFKVQSLVRTGPQFDPSTDAHTFTILASDYCVLTFLSRVMQRILQEAPHIRINIQSMVSPIEELVEANVDLLISAGDWSLYNRDARHDILHSETLFSDDFVCVTDIGHPLSGEITLDDFLSYPHVAVKMLGGISTLEQAALREQLPDFSPNFTVTEFAAILHLVIGTPFVGIVQRRLAARFKESMPIKVFEPPINISPIHEQMWWHTRNTEEPANKWLRSLISDEAKNLRSEAESSE